MLLLGRSMRDFVPIDALQKRPPGAAVFDLWVPHAFMERALFLRLPLGRDWAFEFNPGEAQAFRYMIYRDQMWVRKGRGRFFALRGDGSRVEINLSVRPWRPRSSQCHLLREVKPWGLLGWLGAALEVIKSRCCRTEREVRIWWRAGGARRQSKPAPGAPSGLGFVKSDVELLLSGLRCH